jgi:type IV pilus assembly protein PilQ
VFGIRYLTGSDQTIERKKELVILLKTELLPTLKERLDNPIKNPLNSELSKQNERVRYYQLESQDSQYNKAKE